MPARVPRVSVLVLGSSGQVGRELMAALGDLELSPIGLRHEDVDISRAPDVRDAVRAVAPWIVVNAAAFTDVDGAEREPERAAAVNAEGPGHIADACRSSGATLVHLSTDYVFDGEKEGAYREDDPENPQSVYGATKLAGERAVRGRLDAHLIVRTSWVYSATGRNFVTTMLRLGRERAEIDVVADQIGSPTAAYDLALGVARVVQAASSPGFGAWGTYHYCGKGAVSWHGLATAVFEAAREHMSLKVERVRPISSEDWPSPVRRPRNSVLDCSKIERELGIPARPWREAVARTVAEIAGREDREGA